MSNQLQPRDSNSAKLIGGILLIVGTSIGAGMLALPVANAATGFPVSGLFLFFCWSVMTFDPSRRLKDALGPTLGELLAESGAATKGGQ